MDQDPSIYKEVEPSTDVAKEAGLTKNSRNLGMISEQPMHRRPAVDPPCISRLPKWLTYVRTMSCSTWYHWLLANVSQRLGQL